MADGVPGAPVGNVRQGFVPLPIACDVWENHRDPRRKSLEIILDLDAVAALLESQRSRLIAAGCTVAPLTWRDPSEPSWPDTLKTDRVSVLDPDSVGLKVETPDNYAEVVVFRGGWADACWGQWAGLDEPTWHSPSGLADLAAVERMLERAFQAFFLR
jgi:hypothetical protein